MVPAAGLSVPVRLRPGVRLRCSEGPGPRPDADLLRQCGRDSGRGDEGPPGLHGSVGHHGGAGVFCPAGPLQFVLYPLHALLCRRGRAGGDHRRHPLLLLELCGDRHALGGHPRRGGPPLLRRVDPQLRGGGLPENQRRAGGADGHPGGELHGGGIPAAGGDLHQLQPV